MVAWRAAQARGVVSQQHVLTSGAVHIFAGGEENDIRDVRNASTDIPLSRQSKTCIGLDMAKLHRNYHHNTKRHTATECHLDETYVRIEYDRYTISEAWVLLPDHTVEHLICYPPGRSAKLARKIEAADLDVQWPCAVPTYEVSEKMEKLVDLRFEKIQWPCPIAHADVVMPAKVIVDPHPPKHTSRGVMPQAEHISADQRSWIGTYNLPEGGYLKRTSMVLDETKPPCYTANDLKVVDCPVDRKGRAMVRFFYVQTGRRLGLWKRVMCKMLCA